MLKNICDSVWKVLVNKHIKNFECLLINDGSPDNSAEICREYVEKDARSVILRRKTEVSHQHVIWGLSIQKVNI